MKKSVLLLLLTLAVKLSVLAQAGTAATAGYITGKIPVDSNRWYQLNTAGKSLGALFNGVTNEIVETGYGKVLQQWDAYYPLLDDEEMNIDSIKLFDGQGSNPDKPLTLSVITADWRRIPVAVFTGGSYMSWVGPYPGRSYQAGENVFKLDSTIHNPRYLVLNTYWAYPTEIELYGSYKPSSRSATAYQPKKVRLNQGFGVNAFEWNFEHPGNPLVIDETRMNMVKSFAGVRHYMDWEKLEATQGGYTYNPCHSGGWNYDTMYARCKAEGIEVLADLKQLTSWLLNTWPAGERNWENVPVAYGSDFANPASYVAQAKAAFQYAARYGRNKAVPDALLHVNSSTRWTNDPPNVIRKGLDYIQYVECDNERNKWWLGRKAYQTGREYAANLSAFYDGHKHTLGPDAGVKTADSTMQVVMAGLAGAETDYVRGMIDWCKEFRGYKSDGRVDLCWDVINYHFYAGNAPADQVSTRGAAPEQSEAAAGAQRFLQLAHDYAYDMPVWITEAGYDINGGSPYHAIPIGSKTALQTQADWMLRTSLLYNRLGIERVFFYEMYDENAQNGSQYASSGLVNDNFTRRPAADFLNQANRLMGNYIYQETISASPLVDRYSLNGQDAYILMMPTENGSTVNYKLYMDDAATATIYTPVAGKDSMQQKRVSLTNGVLTVQVTETPVFVIPSGKNIVKSILNTVKALLASVKIYPNPVTDYLTLQLTNEYNTPVTVAVYDFAGRQLKKTSFPKPAQAFTNNISLGDLSPGMYLVEVQQQNEKVTRSIVKQ